MNKNNPILVSSRHIVLVAMMSATLVAGKFALSFIPNVEIVTSLIIIYAFVFRWDAVGATLIFCTLDIILYPPSLDVVISYYIYWDALCLAVITLRSLGVTGEIPYLVTGIVMTALFGLLTTLMSHIVFGIPYWPMYLAGIPFYVTQILSTLVFMLFGFKPLTKLLTRLNASFIGPKDKPDMR